MNPLHKALYRHYFNIDSEPDERQERVINGELARCLIYLFWFDWALLLITTAHDRLEGIFMSAMTAVLLINLTFIGVFTLTNENCQELQAQDPDITLENLPQYLQRHKKWAIIFGAYMSLLMASINFRELAFAAYPLSISITFLYGYGLLIGLLVYRHDKKKALRIIAAKQAAASHPALPAPQPAGEA